MLSTLEQSLSNTGTTAHIGLAVCSVVPEFTKAAGLKRAKNLAEAAEHSIGRREGSIAARLEICMLLEDHESRAMRLQEIMTLIESLIKQVRWLKSEYSGPFSITRPALGNHHSG